MGGGGEWGVLLSEFCGIKQISSRFLCVAGTRPLPVLNRCISFLFLLQPTRVQWQKVFYISAGMYVFGWVTYLLLGSGKQQSWNTPYEDLLVPIDIPREPRKPFMADILSINHTGADSVNSSDAQLPDTSHSADEC